MGDGVLKNSFLLAWRGGLVTLAHRLQRARVIEDVTIPLDFFFYRLMFAVPIHMPSSLTMESLDNRSRMWRCCGHSCLSSQYANAGVLPLLTSYPYLAETGVTAH